MLNIRSQKIESLIEELSELQNEYYERFPKQKSYKQQLEEQIKIYKFLLNK